MVASKAGSTEWCSATELNLHSLGRRGYGPLGSPVPGTRMDPQAGIEPATSTVAWSRSGRLSYCEASSWQPREDSNPHVPVNGRASYR